MDFVQPCSSACSVWTRPLDRFHCKIRIESAIRAEYSGSGETTLPDYAAPQIDSVENLVQQRRLADFDLESSALRDCSS